jgi:hypothetical protein
LLNLSGRKETAGQRNQIVVAPNSFDIHSYIASGSDRKHRIRIGVRKIEAKITLERRLAVL